jgi:hypothetical protein
MDLWRPNGEIIDGGSGSGERGKRRKKERRRRKKGSAETLWTLRAPASLVSGGAPYPLWRSPVATSTPKGATIADALLCTNGTSHPGALPSGPDME